MDKYLYINDIRERWKTFFYPNCIPQSHPFTHFASLVRRVIVGSSSISEAKDVNRHDLLLHIQKIQI